MTVISKMYKELLKLKSQQNYVTQPQKGQNAKKGCVFPYHTHPTRAKARRQSEGRTGSSP